MQTLPASTRQTTTGQQPDLEDRVARTETPVLSKTDNSSSIASAYALLQEAADSSARLREAGVSAELQHGGVGLKENTGYAVLLDGSAQKVRVPLKPNDIDPLIVAAEKLHTSQAFDVMDRLISAKDPVTGLLPVHVRTEGGKLVAADHIASGLDMGRMTAGLVMVSELAKKSGDSVRAQKYLDAAIENYARGKKLLAQGDIFVHRRDFNDDGSVKSTEVGEPGKSAPGEDNMSRVNPRAYAFRAAAELYRATGKEEYKLDFARYFKAWVRDFHDGSSPGGFFIHANVSARGDHKEIGAFTGPGGAATSYDGREGIKGNDGTIYALSSVLLQANEILGTEQTRSLVKEQIDILLDRFHNEDGTLWENYTKDFQRIAVDWQSQPMVAREGEAARTSHVAVGGHTAMAGQQIIEGARQLRDQGMLTAQEYRSYVDRTVEMFQSFATHSGAIDWTTGRVHNAMRVEDSHRENRWLRDWGDASWQQAELIQTLLRFREEGRLADLRGPDGKTGEDLLRLAELDFASSYSMPASYAFNDYFGNPDPYHRPQLALYHQQLTAQLDPTALAISEARLAATSQLSNALELLRDLGAHPERRPELERSLDSLKTLAAKAGMAIDAVRDSATGMSFAMAAAAAGDLAAYQKALAIGSDPAKDRNPINGATQAHFAALAVRPLGDAVPPANTEGAEILRAMERKIGVPAMVELVNTRNTLSEHNAFTDVAFYRNNGAALYLLNELLPKARERGATIDFTAPSARGVLPRDLIGRSPGSFSEAVRNAAELQGPLRAPDGTSYPDVAALREARHRGWAKEHGLNENDVVALIGAAEQHDFARASALIEKLGLPGGLDARIGYMGQTLLHFNVMGQFGDPARTQAALQFQQQAIAAGADPTTREDRLMNVDPFIRASALGQRGLAFDIASWVGEHHGAAALKALLDARGVNNGRTALIDAVYALDWEAVGRLRELGADPKMRGYDGIPLGEIARLNARAANAQVPPDLAAWLA